MSTPAEPRETDKVYAGVALSTAQATRAVLNLIHSPMTGDMTKDTTRRLVERLKPSGDVYHLLSKGEQNLVKLALELWDGPSPLGGIDRVLKLKVLLIMWYYYLGSEGDMSHYASDLTYLTEMDFHRLFPKGPDDKPYHSGPK